MILENAEILAILIVSFILVVLAFLLNSFMKYKGKKMPKVFNLIRNWLSKILKKSIVLFLSFLVICVIFLSIAAIWKVFGFKSKLSSDMQDWGAYATCLTAAFSAISIGGIYWTYRSQVKTSRLSSFDTLFSQMLNNHNALYDKVTKNNPYVFQDMVKCFVIYANISSRFYLCKNLEKCDNWNKCKLKGKCLAKNYKYRNDYSKCLHDKNNKDDNVIVNGDIVHFYTLYTDCIINDFSNFSNYFKYIYHEVMFVYNQEDFFFRKKKYISIIQSQMNNDELFCYLLNLIDYHYKKTLNEEKLERCVFAKIVKDLMGLFDMENVDDKKNSIESYRKCLVHFDFFKDLVTSEKHSILLRLFDPKVLENFISDETLECLCRDNT